MKSAYLMTDLEGVAGVVSFHDQSYPSGKYYEQAKHLLTAEVNAAVNGLLDSGVEDILVWDGHGAGGICFEELHAAAKLMHGRPVGPRARRDEATAGYDACLIVGQHAMAGTVGGNQNHTQSSMSIDYYKLNGKPIGEIAQFALYQGAMGQPLIFLSGDEDACAEAEDLIDGVVTVGVKKGLGRGAAISLSASEARRRISESVRQAVEQHRENPIPPLVWDPPYVLEKRFFHTDTADGVASQPGVERIDSQTVRLQGDDIKEIIYR